ncbi:MAG TPA: TlpA disulfide reductase family protein [Usitatibacter sp.]|nr:TlpA disulfide reductase family protein [Usitatibacter sp.]
MLRGLLALAVLFASASVGAEAQFRSWTKKSTPPLARPDLAGRNVDLRNLHGRVVLVNFWATWCEPCRDEMPALERLRAKLEGQPFEVLAVNFGESSAKVSDFLKHEGLTLKVLLDSDKAAAGDWNAKGLPMSFLVDANGRVRFWVFGERDWSQGEALRVVQKLLAEAPGARH